MTICDNSSHEIVQQEKCRLYTTATVASWDLFPLRPIAVQAAQQLVLPFSQFIIVQ